MNERSAGQQSDRSLTTEVHKAQLASQTSASSEGGDRRAFLKSSSGAAAAFMAMGQAADMSTAEAAQPAGSRIETVSGHAPFTLPRDHKFHGGGIYDTGHLEEWHYVTGFFTDDQTGEELCLFYNIFREGVKPGVLIHRLMSSLGNPKTKEFVWVGKVLPGPLTASAPAGSTSPDDFQYSHGAPTDETSFTTIYRAATDTWTFRCKTVASNPAVPYAVDLELVPTKKPFGYLAMTPTGFEPQNVPWIGQWDPQTMGSTSYYYGAPKMAAKGTITVGGKVRRITGSMWLEHQWGNFSFVNTPWPTAYIWSAFQFDDGSIFTFRQWVAEDGKMLLDMGRHVYGTPDGKMTYGFGRAVVWEGLKTWKSPVSGHVFPVEGRVTSPFGTFYYTAMFNPYEMPIGYPPYGKNGLTLFEGPVLLRRDSLEGPVVGRAFLELPAGLTKNYPEKA
jgi:predicted secreted hydrolase